MIYGSEKETRLSIHPGPSPSATVGEAAELFTGSVTRLPPAGKRREARSDMTFLSLYLRLRPLMVHRSGVCSE
jgi:hypothetical protein